MPQPPASPDRRPAGRYWTDRAREEHSRLLADMDAAQSHDESLGILRRACCRLVGAGDPEGLCAVFRIADTRTEAATEMRFATAIAAMAAKQYACAYAAWDDGGGACWSSVSDDPWVPDSARAAAVLMEVCEEARAIREGVPPPERLAGDASALCEMMGRLSTDT